MSDSMSLSTKLPGQDQNGLRIEDLLKNRDHPVMVIATLDVTDVSEHVKTGAQKVKLQWRLIEPVTLPGDVATLRRLAERALEARTGQAVLPLSWEEMFREIGEAVASGEAPEENPADNEGDTPGKTG